MINTTRKHYVQDVPQRSVLEQVIADISEKLISLPIEQTGEGINFALESLGRFSGVDSCRLIQFGLNPNITTLTHVWRAHTDTESGGTAKLDQFRLHNYVATRDDIIVRELMAQGFAVVNDLTLIMDRSPILQDLHGMGLQSFLVVGLVHGQDRIGYLGLDVVSAAREWSDEDVQLAQIVGRLISGALLRHRAFRQLERQAAIQHVVADVSSRFAISTPEQLDDNVQYALQRLGEFTKVDVARLFFFSTDGRESRNTHEWVASGIPSQKQHLQGLQAENEWWMRQFLSQHVVCFHVSDLVLPEDSVVKNTLMQLGVQSLLGVALYRDGVVVGELGLDTLNAKKDWPADEIACVQLMAEAVNSALLRKHIHDELEHRLAFENLVADISNRFASIAPEQTDVVITETLRQIGGFLGADYCRLFQFNTDAWTIQNTHEWVVEGLPSRMHLIQNYAFEANDFAWFNYLKQRQLIFFPTLDDMPEELHICRPKLELRGIESRASVALWRDDIVFGEMVLDVLRNQIDFSPKNIRLLQVVAEIIGNALNRKHSYEQLQQRLNFEHLIADISARFNAAAPEQVDEVIHYALRRICEFSGIDGARLFLLSEDGLTVSNTHEWFAGQQPARKHLLQNLSMSDPGREYLYRQLMQDGMIYYNKVADMPLAYGTLRDALSSLGVRSFINVLLRRGDEILGDLGLSSQRATIPFVAENLQLLRVVSELISNVLARKQADTKLRHLAAALEVERNQLEYRVAKRTKELAQLLEVAKTISLALDLPTFMAIVLRSLKEVIPVNAGGIWELKPENQLRQLARSSPDIQISADALWTYDPDQDVHLLEMIRSRRPVVIHNVDAGDAFSIAHRQRWVRVIGALPEQIRASIYVPLVSHDHVAGFLALHSDTPGFFDESKVMLVQAFASQVAVSMENALLHEQKVHAAAMAERSRLARELHDSVSQALFGVVLGARTAIQQAEQAGNAPPSEAMNYVLKLSEAALAEMRALIYELRPESLQAEGLIAALRRQATALSARHNLQVELQVDDEELILPIKATEALYRIGVEAVQNTIKHALATKIVMQVRKTADEVVMQIQDNGHGFDLSVPHPGHFGLIGMRERAENLGAQFLIQSVSGEGTRIEVHIPLTALV